MQFIIRPYVGVNDLLFGMTESQTCSMLGREYSTRASVENNPLKEHVYPAIGVRLDFSRMHGLVAIDMFRPADPVLDGVSLLGMSYAHARLWLRERDPDCSSEYGAAKSTALGLYIYSPNYEDCEAEPIESVLAFARDHFAKFQRGEYK